MNKIWTVNSLVLVMLLAGCEKQTEPAATAADDQAAADATSSVPQLMTEVRSYDLDELQTADQINAVCEGEVAMLNESIVALEQFADAPGVSNYLKPLNAMRVSYSNMSNAVQVLGAVHPDADAREASDKCTQALSAVSSDLGLSRLIFDRVSGVDVTTEDAGTQRFVEKLLLSYSLSGVDKDEATRARIKELNEEITTVGQEFDKNIRESVLYLELNSVDQLAGLPQDYIDGHPADENGVIRISTQFSDVFPFLTYAEDDDLRKQLSVTRANRAYPENGEVLQKLLELRFELAQLLGFENYAERITADKMAKSPQRVNGFLDELAGYTEETVNREYELLLARLQQDRPDAERLESWQRRFVQEKVTTEQFNVDSKEVREYFNYNSSREGILRMVQDLFNVQIKPWSTTTWQEDVEPYELWDGDQLIGRFYLDMHQRENKYQHAAVFPMRTGITGVQTPLAGLICNFPRGDELMQHAQVVTFLHEFGHLIHFMFAGEHDWGNVSGISTEWDFVEAPSQMLQEWVWDYDTISQFARNADGEVIPRELLDKMIAARDFGIGFTTRGQLSLAAMSMGLYNQNPEGLDIKAYTDEVTRKFTVFDPMEEGHFYAAFGHLNGYSAIYYTYQWSLAIATDMFTRFEKDGLRNVETAGSYRDTVLGQGSAKPAAELVSDFLGREISFKPYADRLSQAGTSAGDTD
jgi:thimet oligopeptidase